MEAGATVGGIDGVITGVPIVLGASSSISRAPRLNGGGMSSHMDGAMAGVAGMIWGLHIFLDLYCCVSFVCVACVC